VLDAMPAWEALAIWFASLLVDAWQFARRASSQPRVIASFRADFVLPASVLLAYVLLGAWGRQHLGRPIPAFVLPVVLFMGVHEYSIARGAGIAFVLGYATDVLGIAPVGLFTFTYVAIFVLARAAGVRLAAQTTWMQLALVFTFAAIESTIVLVLLAIFGRDPWVPKSLYPLALPHAIATAAIAPLVFRMAHAVQSASGPASARDGSVGALP
jgi:rod shape-determining protein MreD